jgi:hypothetical protein
MMTERSTDLRSEVSRGLILAALLLAASFGAKRLSPEYLSPDLAHRLLGVLMGGVVVVYANAVPKAITPLIETRCDPGACQAIRRFAGWSLVIGGAAYAGAWALAPLRIADLLAVSFLGAFLLLVITRILWGIKKSKQMV